jgi:hypothetical protein
MLPKAMARDAINFINDVQRRFTSISKTSQAGMWSKESYTKIGFIFSGQ